MAADFLRNASFDVIEAGNTLESLAVLKAGTPVDVVFSDVHMPGAMNGIDLARWIAAHYPARPVILTLSNRDADAAAKVALFLPKHTEWPMSWPVFGRCSRTKAREAAPTFRR